MSWMGRGIGDTWGGGDFPLIFPKVPQSFPKASLGILKGSPGTPPSLEFSSLKNLSNKMKEMDEVKCGEEKGFAGGSLLRCP